MALLDNTTPANTTLNALDAINGGLGANAMTLNVVGNATTAIPGGVTISNVQTMNVRGSGKLGAVAGDFDVSGVAGLETLNITLASDVFAKAATTTNVNVSGATGGITTDGGKNVSVSDATADMDISVGATTKAAGNVTVTDTNQGTADIYVKADGIISITASKQGATADIAAVGGTDVAVTANSTADSGNITVGAGTAPTGAVVVTENITSDGTAAVATGNITTNGGTTVAINVNATSSAKDSVANAAITVGPINVTAGSSTTAVAINQNDSVTTFTKPAVAVVGATQTLKFGALTAGQTTTVGGLTFKAVKALTAAEVAAAFAGLTAADTQSAGGLTANGAYSGSLAAGWTSGAASGDTVVFTAATDAPGALTVTDGDVDPASTYLAGTASAGKVESTNAVVFGDVVVNEGGTASVTYVGINGYKTADLGVAGADLNALTTLSLADSAGVANVATSATTLAVTVNNVKHAVSLDAAGAATVATLNLTATGKDSAFALTAAAAKTLAVSGDKAVSLTADLEVLETVTVSGSAGLTLAEATANTVKSINTTATTGTVTAFIDGTVGTYTGGAGKDVVTLVTGTALNKAIDLGAGDDTLVFGAAVTGSTAVLSGGEGTDTLSMTTANAAALDDIAQTFYTGFERLTINDAGATSTINLANLGFTSYVTTNGSAGTLTLNNLASNGTVVLTAAGGVTVVVKDAATGTADVLNAVLSKAASQNFGTLTAANVETVNLTSTDTTTPFDAAHTLALVADKATTVNVSGNAGLDLTLTAASGAVLDASAMTGVLTFTAGAANLVVKGGSAADNLTADANDVALYGNGGADILTVNTGLRVNLYGGDGADTFVFNAGASTTLDAYTVINGVTSGDVIKLTGADSFSSTKIALSVGADETLLNYANQAVKSLGSGDIGWFQRGGNTYVVQDVGADTDAFAAGTDMIVMITGLVDLTTASYNATSNILQIA